MKKIFFILSLLASLFYASVGSAQVVLTDDEAMTLGHELSIAKSSIDKSRTELKTAKQRLAELSQELEQQKVSLTEQQLLLNDANKYLKELNEEHKKQVKRISRQRNFAYALAGVFVYIACKK